MSKLEIYADIWCPFAYVGLIAALSERKGAESSQPLLIRSWPLELVNGQGLDPTTTKTHVDELRDQVAQDLFRGFQIESFPTSTLPALALVAAAYEDDLVQGEAISIELRTMFFEEGRDISDDQVLVHLARRFDLDPDARLDNERVLVDWHEGQRRGVMGSPHFFCGDRDIFCPLLEIEKDEHGHLNVARNKERLDAFLARCFS